MLLGLILLGMVIYGVSLVINELSEETGLMVFMCTVTHMSYQCISSIMLFLFLNTVGFICMLILIDKYTFRFRNEKAIDVIYNTIMEMIVTALMVVVIFAIALHGSRDTELSKLAASIVIIFAVLISFIHKYVQCLIKHSNKKQGGEY